MKRLSTADNCTEFVGGGAQYEAHSWSKVQLILRHAWWGSKAKVLQKEGEEEEELHPGQTLSQTHPAP